MYNIAICDDDKNYIRELKETILACNKGKLVLAFYEFDSGEALLHSKIHEMDVIFLDIHMPGMDGNETAVRLNQRGYQGLLVQCSGVFMPTPETIKISPYRYLLKQDAVEKTVSEIKEILSQMVTRKRGYEIEASYLRLKEYFRVDDIAYITHHQKGSELHLRSGVAEKYRDGKIIAPYSFEELLVILKEADFSVPHNSHMVNLRYVSDIDPKAEFFVVDGKKLSMSRSRKDAFLKDMASYKKKK